MTYRGIPETMTALSDGEEWQPGDTQLGRPLNRRMTAWLLESYRGKSREQRMGELADYNPAAATAYGYRDAKRAASAMGVSISTAYRLRSIAFSFMGEFAEFPADGSLENKMDWLRLNEPEEHDTFVLVCSGYGDDAIAGITRVHPQTVRARMRRARERLGVDAMGTPGWKIARFRLAKPVGHVGDDGDLAS